MTVKKYHKLVEIIPYLQHAVFVKNTTGTKNAPKVRKNANKRKAMFAMCFILPYGLTAKICHVIQQKIKCQEKCHKKC